MLKLVTSGRIAQRSAINDALNRVEAFTSISENGRSIQCSKEQIAIVGSNMTVVVHFKNDSVASFNYEDGELKDYVEGKDLKDVVVW